MKSKSKMITVFVWGVFPIALVLLLSLQAGRAQAATFVVNSTADAVDAAPGNGFCATAVGVCTLRAAIQEANALRGADVITVPAGTYTLTIPGVNEDYSVTGDLDITSDLAITGAGANTTTIDAGAIDRVLEVRSENKPNVHISGLTVTGGKSVSSTGNGSGGGILSGGTLTLTSVTVSANSADSGGGIYFISGHTVTLNSSTVSGNTGGGILMYHGILILNNSTVSGNVTKYGGGIITSNHSIVLNLSNSTISGNTGNNGGGGIRTGEYATINLKNTIVAGNLHGGDCEISSTVNVVNSLGHNLDSDGTCKLIKPTDLPNRQQPLLGPLTNSGGSTQTHALLTGSPAIDKGGDCLAVDQRGVPRPQGAGCDIGAYEVGTVQDTIPPETTIASVVDGNALVVASGGSTLSASITFTFGSTDAVGVAGFQCSRDGSAYATCSSPLGYSALATGSHTFEVRALDAAGNVDPTPASFTWTAITSAEAIQNLINTIGNMRLSGGVATSLTAPLSNINTNNKAAACAKLNAFINQVNAQGQNGQLTSAQGDQLLQAANAIKASLGC